MKVHNLTQYVTITSQLAAAAGQVWFRGVRSHRHHLLPSLYRLGEAVWTNDQYLDLEQDLINRFSERSMPYREGQAPTTELEYLFEMQHYGAPTRLLDWSENAFMALWFALEVPDGRRARVWVMDPQIWNKCAIPNRSDIMAPLSPSNPAVEGLLPWELTQRNQMLDPPLCVYGLHNSRRIVGQRGVFTLSGKSRAPMEEQAASLASTKALKTNQLLVAIDVPSTVAKDMRRELARVGFSRSMIYPDLVGLAEELKERAIEGSL